MTTDERRFLEHMRQLLDEGWTQNKFAEDYDGYECSPHHPHAAKFCVLGAAMRTEEKLHLHFPTPRAWLVRLFGFLPGDDLTQWNDAPNRTKEQILARIDAALS